MEIDHNRCWDCGYNPVPETVPSEAPVRVQRADVPLRELAEKLGAALKHQDEAWGLYGEQSKAALREWEEWRERHIDPAHLPPT